MLGKDKKQTLEQKKAAMKTLQNKRHNYEMKHCGGYELILPSKDAKYKGYLDTAKKIWTAFNSNNLTKEDIQKLKEGTKPKKVTTS